MIKALETLLTRAATWPAEAQEELARVAGEIEGEVSGAIYRLSAAERAAILEGLAQADRGEFVPDAEIDAIFAHRET